MLHTHTCIHKMCLSVFSCCYSGLHRMFCRICTVDGSLQKAQMASCELEHTCFCLMESYSSVILFTAVLVHSAHSCQFDSSTPHWGKRHVHLDDQYICRLSASHCPCSISLLSLVSRHVTEGHLSELHTHTDRCMYMCTHTNTPACAHAYVGMYMRTHTHTQTPVCAHAQLGMCMHTHKHMCAHAHIACTYAHTSMDQKLAEVNKLKSFKQLQRCP